MAGNSVELQFITRKSVSGVEWKSRDGAPPLVALAGGEPASFEQVGDELSGDYRVLAVNPDSPYDLVNVIWATGEPAVVVAQGTNACTQAAQAAVVGTGAVRALVLIDFGDAQSLTWLSRVSAPTLVFRGRQSEDQTHEEAVDLHETIRNSHLIEPEDCGGGPITNNPAVLAESISWYLGSLGDAFMEYSADGEPVDPKS